MYLSVLTALVLSTGAVQAAQPQPTAPVQGEREAFLAALQPGDAERIQRLLAELEQNRQGERLRPALRNIDALLRYPFPAELTAGFHLVRGAILRHLGERAQSLAAFDRAIMLKPGDAAIPLTQLESAVAANDFAMGSQAVQRLITHHPDALRDSHVNSVRHVFQLVRSAPNPELRDDLVVRAASAGLARADYSLRQEVVSYGLRASVRLGRMDQAQALLPELRGVKAAAELLADRRMEAFWPRLEEWAGPNMTRVIAGSLAAAQADFERDPNRVAMLHPLMLALRDAGRLEDADRIGAGYARNRADVREIDESGGWLVNDHAILLARMGRWNDADARWGGLRALDIADHPWLISMVLNRASFLAKGGRWQDASALLDEAASLSATYGTPYARQIARAARVCTAKGLGRIADAERTAAELIRNASDGYNSAVDGLLCLGRIEDAERMMIRWLGDEDQRTSAITALQPTAIARQTTETNEERWTELALRPAVAAALTRQARILPEHLVPARAAASRTPATP